MRHTQKLIEKARLRGQRRGLASQKKQRNSRLEAALSYGPIRPTESYLVFEIGTHNPKTDVYHFMEIRHEMLNGNDRYSVYLDGVRWHKQFSRWGFCKWLFGKIDSVRSDWC